MSSSGAAGQSSKPAKAGSSQPSETSVKRKRGMFQKDLQHMMYGFGDDPNRVSNCLRWRRKRRYTRRSLAAVMNLTTLCGDNSEGIKSPNATWRDLLIVLCSVLIHNSFNSRKFRWNTWSVIRSSDFSFTLVGVLDGMVIRNSSKLVGALFMCLLLLYIVINTQQLSWFPVKVLLTHRVFWLFLVSDLVY
ncbi:unnamed protein product [Linum tenue]|uniref:Uncharacterized protein n=1 Tax=Linum tenue TaxID=586396 RepID=A0AAV0Q6D4_9ROSI|nr:unnamed protein product [Linum tenue]